MRIIQLTLALLFAAVATPFSANAADSVSVRAILISATNQKQAADPKLAPYEAELQRNLPLSSFRYVGEGSASVSTSGRATVSITVSMSRDHRLELTGFRSDEGVGVKVQWLNGSTLVLSSALSISPGSPTVTVFGRRPSDDGETPIVLLIAK
jgi:hypothetical protein